ncbi:hypothetical protein [Ferrimicrobium sp.]|uniref:hypothetical protein n=1 Tax=Ferrimicrobium sp. TaxID=2926050 RepID=UPI002634BC89|nr:hypothetical protein [Ferrimicrobium sp.]
MLVLVLLAIVFVFGGFLVASGRYDLHPIRSGAMRPSFEVGGLAVAERVPTSSLAPRDVIVFARPGDPQDLIARRLLSLTHNPNGVIEVRTKGDDRPRADPWTLQISDRTSYQVRFTLPLIGVLVAWDRNGNGATGTYFILGGLVLIFLVMLWKSERRLESDGKHDGAAR